MSERSKVSLRLIVVTLIVANALMLAYTALKPDSVATAGARIDELQINPGRIRLQNTATRGPGGTAGGSALYRACLEWGPFAGGDTGKADSALARLTLPRPAIQRPLSEVDGVRRYAYFVREPNAAIVAQIAELQRRFPGTDIKAGPCP